MGGEAVLAACRRLAERIGREGLGYAIEEMTEQRLVVFNL